MTIKEAMTRVCDDTTTFPEGWNTQIAEVIRKSGGAYYERQQKQVWMLRIRTPYNGEAETITLYRLKEKAIAAMEADIRDTLALHNPRFDSQDLARTGDCEAQLGDEIYWSVERVKLEA